jgi:hypothetical protein
VDFHGVGTQGGVLGDSGKGCQQRGGSGEGPLAEASDSGYGYRRYARDSENI